MHSEQIRGILDWLSDGARSEPDPAMKMKLTCEQLVAAGIPLHRVGVFVETLHPDIYGHRFIWRADGEVEVGSTTQDVEMSEEYKRSPLKILYDYGVEVRFRLDDPESKNFPFLDDLRAEAVTDYTALPLRFLDGTYHAASFATKQPGGFTDSQLSALRAMMPPLSRLVEVISLRDIATNLLDTYVGNRAGARILAGQIRRGHADHLRAAIWLSDLRGFSALSDGLPPEIMVKVLNAHVVGVGEGQRRLAVGLRQLRELGDLHRAFQQRIGRVDVQMDESGVAHRRGGSSDKRAGWNGWFAEPAPWQHRLGSPMVGSLPLHRKHRRGSYPRYAEAVATLQRSGLRQNLSPHRHHADEQCNRRQRRSFLDEDLQHRPPP